MASGDARPVPEKNVAMRVTFPILDADGDLVTGAAGLDSEVSKDGGAFADAGSEATEIAASSGMYFLDLTNTEMNADTVAVIVKTSTVGAKTTPIVMYPQEADDIRAAVTHWVTTAVATPTVNGVPEVDLTHIAGDATAGTLLALLANQFIRATGVATAGAINSITLAVGSSAVDDRFKDMLLVTISGAGSGQARLIGDYVGATRVATPVPDFDTAVDNTTGYVIFSAARSDIGLVSGDTVAAHVAAIAAAAATSVWAAGTRTLTAIGSGVMSTAALEEIADTTLGRDLSAVAGAASRSLLNAIRFLRNRWAIVAGVGTVYEEDDATPAWTFAATQTSGDPVSEIDPT